jgi:hypothetical protein
MVSPWFPFWYGFSGVCRNSQFGWCGNAQRLLHRATQARVALAAAALHIATKNVFLI